jgi:guanine deaminase
LIYGANPALPVPGAHGERLFLLLLCAYTCSLTKQIDSDFDNHVMTEPSPTAKAFMSRAIQLSVENVRSGRGGPFGAVLVKDGSILAEGVNQVTAANDPTAHAEVLAIRQACQKLGCFELKGCDLYTSCEPCPMCLGAIYWAHIDKVYFANLTEDAAKIGFDDSAIYKEIAQPRSGREIPMIQMMREDALAAFRAWERSSNRTIY